MRLRAALLIVCFFAISASTPLDDCHGARTTGNFSSAQVSWFCSREEEMSSMESEEPLTLTHRQWSFLDSLAVEPLQNIRRPPRRHKRQNEPPPVTRKEYRMLSDEERQRLHSAVNHLKVDRVDGKSKWDIFTEIHNPAKARNAHWGPGFLPWHREFLHRVESALRFYDQGVAIPYWDSTLDSGLPDPADSVLWSPEFLGNGDGFVTQGPFARWATHEPLSLSRADIRSLYRTVGNDSRGRLYAQDDVDWILNRTHYSDFSFCEDKTFERTHGLSHLYVGGFLEPLRLSANDPAFYFLHSFVDHLWELFRRHRQSPQQRETEWLRPGHQVCKTQHQLGGSMIPFPGLRNGDGLSNRYTDRLYKYDPRPSCLFEDGLYNCGSRYLFCDTRVFVCRSKVRAGGHCEGFEGTPICHESDCAEGLCQRPTSASAPNRAAAHKRSWEMQSSQLQTTTTTTSPATPSTRPPPPVMEEPCTQVYFKVLVWDVGGPARSSSYEVGLRGLNHFASDRTWPMSHGEFPEHGGVAYVRACRPTATLTPVHVQVEARDPFGSECRAFCFFSQLRSFSPCNGTLRLSRRTEDSDPVAYTHDLQARRVLGAKLSGHPASWDVDPPFVSFLCGGANEPGVILDYIKTLSPAYGAYSTVWFQTVVLDRAEPFRRAVEGATATAADQDEPHFTDSVSIHHSSEAPYYSGAVYLRARNPQFYSAPVRLQLDVSMSDGSLCRAVCSGAAGRSRTCDGALGLSLDPAASFPIPFTTDWDLREYLGWALRGHPQDWTHQLAPIRFYCTAVSAHGFWPGGG